jgi:hypothetical protein
MFVMVFKYFQVFSQVFQTLVSSVSFIFFYVATVASGCFESRSDGVHRMRVERG